MRAKSVFVITSLYCLLLLNISQAQLDAVNIGEVVENLGRRFQEIRNEGLGIDRLEAAYRDANFDFDTLTPSDIETLISQTDSAVSSAISSVTTLFNNVMNDSPVQTVTPTDCLTSSGSSACCFQCSSIQSQQSDRAARVAGLFSDSTLPAGSQLFFGFSNGPMVRYPPNSPDNSTEQDSRLQRWFRRSFQKPLEVVLVVDLAEQTSFPEEFSNTLKEAATAILRSLTQQDRVGVVRVDFNTMLPRVISRLSDDLQNPETVPVCDDTIAEMEKFAVSVSEDQLSIGDTNVTAAFLEAINLFSDDSSTEKVLVSLLSGLLTTDNGIVDVVRSAIAARGDDILVASYRAVSNPAGTLYEDLSEVGRGGGVDLSFRGFGGNQFPVIPQTGAFYSYYLLNSPVSTTDVIVGSSFTADGGGMLTLSQPVVNGTDLIGVLHAELPLQQILSHALTTLAGRDSSYVFTASRDNNLLFHSLLPTGLLTNIPLSEIESDGDINTLLSSTSPGVTQTSSITKTLLVSTTVNSVVGFVLRRVPATYYCRQSQLVYVCMLLADEDLTMASLNQQNVNVDGTYTSEPSRKPLYHNLRLSAPNVGTCDYFCTSTVANRISFQLTSPSQPPRADDQSLVDEVTRYISGTGPRPSWVAEGVSEEISLGSSVVSRWTDTTTNISDYISRRHLATSSGAYLTFPPAQFVFEFRPRITDWYTAAIAHPSLITLIPPQETLREGSRLTVTASYAVGAPSPESESHTLSVVAADLTLDTLRAFIRDAIPLCETNNQFSCLIVDDNGNIIYDDTVVRSIMYSGSPVFFGADFSGNSFQQRKTLITDLLRHDKLLSKHECEDYYVIGIDTVRFFHLDLNYNGSVSGSGVSGCLTYKIQRIPGTNAFMVALQHNSACSELCFCARGNLPTCLNCDTFSERSCECPCTCRAECHEKSRSVPLTCPQRILEDANQNLAVRSMTPVEGTCFNQACNCRTTYDSCLGVRECSWCEAQQKCVFNTECCDTSEENCCTSSPQIARFDYLTCGLTQVCQAGRVLTATCPTPAPNTAIIAAGIVGGLFAALLLVFIVVLFVWYQVCRRDDPKDEHSRESAFDFSNKRTEATNPTSSDVVSDDGVNKSVMSSQAPLVDGGKMSENNDTDAATF